MAPARGRQHRVHSLESPPQIAARLRGLLNRGSDWSKPLMLSGGEAPQIDEQSFRCRGAGNRSWSFRVLGMIHPSESGSEVAFEIAPALEYPWIIGLSTASPVAVVLWGFWPISVGLAVGAATTIVALLGAMLALGRLTWRWWVRRSILKAFSVERSASRSSTS
jgi:hypothetical protein